MSKSSTAKSQNGESRKRKAESGKKVLNRLFKDMRTRLA